MNTRAPARAPSGAAVPPSNGNCRYEVTITTGGLLAAIAPGTRITITQERPEEKYTVTISNKPLWIAAL